MTNLPAQGGLPAETLSYLYTAGGQLGALGNDTRSYLNYADYDAFGRNTQVILGATPKQVALTSKYDDATGRLLSTNWDKQSGTASAGVDATSYTYKPSGDVTSVSTVRDGVTTDTQCFAYDGRRRLKEAWTDSGGTTTFPASSVPGIGGCVTQAPSKNTVGGPDPYWQSFDYDVVGNRTRLVEHDVTDDPAKNVTTQYGYRAGVASTDRTHRLDTVTVKTGIREAVTTGLTYDQAGNTKTRPGADANLQTLTWNEEDKLTSVASATGSSDYLYDADGGRIIRREAGKTTLYVGGDELTTSTDGSGPVVGTRYYPTAGGATVVRSGDGTVTYMAADHHGTPTSALDAAALTATRRQSKPFGEPRGAQPTQANGQWPDDKGFLGKPMDSTGLTHVGAREYDPSLGRFISVDPVMDLSDAGQMHGYTYSNNNPLTQSDPSGMKYCGNVMACGDSGTDQTTTSPTAPGGTAHCENYCMDKPKPRAKRQDSGGGNPFKKAWGWTKKKTSQAVTYAKDHWREGVAIVGGVLAEGGCLFAAGTATAATGGIAAGSVLICAGIGGATTGYLNNALDPNADHSLLGATKDTVTGGAWGVTGGAAGIVGGKVVQRVCGGTHSFVPGTGVLMADGTRKAIEDITSGDAVLATDPETGESKPRTVLAAITTEDDKDFVDLTVKTDLGDASIIATTNHPFWVPDLKQWINAGDLKQGQWLQTSAGTRAQIGATRTHAREQRTHDLTVDGDHTYYVLAGTAPILVHNSCGDARFMVSPNGVVDDLLNPLPARGGYVRVPKLDGGTVPGVGNKIWGNSDPEALIGTRSDVELRGLASVGDARKLQDFYAGAVNAGRGGAAGRGPQNSRSPVNSAANRVTLLQEIIDAWGG
ncbi:polymorphic toxin-type HINT domain-containing protein [Embleya sp. AB8]|uniref:polymorphic toxin-type HINT domain-containing protein n=1 Tax=Embleya sp. AB8 TaxID=3156304 RepID=UPI003C773BF0